VDRGFLGVSTLTIDKTLKGLNLPVGHGALVQSVTPGSPAQKAGIHAGNIAASLNGAPIQLGGDVITRIAGSDVRSDRDVVNAVAGRKAGDKVKVTLMRGAHRTEVTVTLGERPATSTP
jgi:S1-C subfamily serine protease